MYQIDDLLLPIHIRYQLVKNKVLRLIINVNCVITTKHISSPPFAMCGASCETHKIKGKMWLHHHYDFSTIHPAKFNAPRVCVRTVCLMKHITYVHKVIMFITNHHDVCIYVQLNIFFICNTKYTCTKS